MRTLLKESLLVLITLSPLAYLGYTWDQLPQVVATHFDLSGKPNGWSDKTTLIYLIGGLGLGMYLLMLVLPKLDPKKKLEEMGSKYFSLRLILAFFFCMINGYIVYSALHTSVDASILFALLGGLFAMLGNYFQTVRPNYFVGIRTPWTLENETVWKNTHKLAGRLWMIGGILVILIAFLVTNDLFRGIAITIVLSTIVIWPILFSYLDHKKLKRTSVNP